MKETQAFLIDIGVNLTHRRFDTDREQVLARALAAGVRQLIVTGTCLRSSQQAAAYARDYPAQLFSTAGIHPHDAVRASSADLAALQLLLQQPEVVAVGECGLDFDRDFSPRPVQQRCFESQVALACAVQKPLFLHEREAHRQLLEILDSFGRELPPVVIHCFTGGQAELENYLARGYYLGITGWICDERRGQLLQTLVKQIPADRLMLETDAPFLTPRDLHPKPRGGRNEPAFLAHILHTVARCREVSVDSLKRDLYKTSQTFFRL